MGLCSRVQPYSPQSPCPGRLLEERIPGQEQGKVTSLSKTTVVTNPSAPPLPGSAGEGPTCSQHRTLQTPPALKVAFSGSSWSPWPLGIQPPAHPMGAGLWGTCGRAPLAMLCLHRGMESRLSRREFLPWGLPCVVPAANPSRALNVTVELGPRGTQVGPPQPLQCSLCSPFGPSSLGRMERARIVPFPLICRQS